MRALLLLALLLPAPGVAAGIGIRPDCSEKKTTVEELRGIAGRKDVHSMLDFLRALPPGSLQTFTFVKGTASFQHHGTSSRWPRVLRASADAKLALSFVCNPGSQDYGRVEILHYVEPPVAAWRSLSLDFRARKLSAHGVEEGEVFPSAGRVHEGSPVCANCHGLGGSPSALLPIIPQYKTWPGFFGSDDDVIHTGTSEEQEYRAFLARERLDPCFGTLPWPKSANKEYELYPFHEGFPKSKAESGAYTIAEETHRIKVRNYHLRPNLKLTDAYSHLLAQRLAWRFLRSPDYRAVAPLLMMEAVNCGPEKVAQGLEQALPGYKAPPPFHRHTFMDPRSEMSWTKQLFAVGGRLGIATREWTMHFNEPEDPYYNTGAAGDEGRDISVGKMAQGVLLSHLAESYPELKPHFRMARSISKFFAPQDFSCIDDVAGQVAIDSLEAREKLCHRLGELAAEGRGSRYAKLALPVEPAARPDEAREESALPVGELLKRLGAGIGYRKGKARAAELALGRKLVMNSCRGCHGETAVLPKPYHFLASERTLAERLRGDAAFLWTAIAYVDSGRMPKGGGLTEEERRAIQLYLIDRAGR